MTYYKSYRIIDGKPRWVIVDENRKIINRIPHKEELKGLEKEIGEDNRKRKEPYNDTNTCDRCGISFENLEWGSPLKEYDEKRDWTGRWDCRRCWSRYDPNSDHNIMKATNNCRTNNQHPNSENMKGEKVQKLINLLKNFEDLNKKFDNYRSSIDSIDPITGLKYQIQGRVYNPKYGFWNFNRLEAEWDKEFHSMFCVCISKDGKIIERIYEFPKEVITTKTISIYKNPSYGGWYDQYRVTNKEEIKIANEIWKDITKLG